MKKIITIHGKAIPVFGNDIDTDRIIPARFLKEITFNRMGEYPFFDERFTEDGKSKTHPFNRTEHKGATILFANSNFGCGSSREHAPQSLMRWGIQAIVAESFAEIFAGNCTMLGIPAVTVSGDLIAKVQEISQSAPETQFTIDLESCEIRSEKIAFKHKFNIPETRRKALLEGTWDSTSILISHADKAKALADSLPPLRYT